MSDRPVFGPVSNLDELRTVVRQISQQKPDSLILYRGQRQLHPSIRSGRARPNAKIPKEVEDGWRALARRMLELPPDSDHGGHVKAILQHYGMPTHFVDVTSDPEVAAWFATKKFRRSMALFIGNAFRDLGEVFYDESDEEFGYVLVLAIDDPNLLRKSTWLVDLSELPEHFVRPHVQKGWLLFDRPPAEPTPNSFWFATIKIDCKAWKSALRTIDLFPSPATDPAYAVLLSLPFVQLPTAYFRGEDAEKNPVGDSSLRVSFDTFCLAKRALDIPDYGAEASDWCKEHKWGDFTIYEPHPVRMWKRWRFDLSSAYEGASGDIKNSIKITLTPEALELLVRDAKPECTWPALGADGVFFSFAVLDHDKWTEHAPPYLGVWLQRDDDLVIEIPMHADEKILSVAAGHGYLFQDGRLVRCSLKGACECDSPETHDQRVWSVLQLSRLLEEGRLILLPHPMLPEWYVAIAGSEAESLLPSVSQFRKEVETFLYSLTGKSARPSSSEPPTPAG